MNRRKKITRRELLKGGAALTASMAMMGLSGCASEASQTTQKNEEKERHVKVAVFSPTEGTKNAAAMLAVKFSKDVEFVDITTPDARVDEVTFSSDDLAIFAAPSYGGQIPMLKGLFSNMKGNNTPCVVVCAFGNRAAENVYANLAKIASDNGFVVIGAMGLVTPHVFSSNAKAGHSRPNVEDNAKMAEFAGLINEKLNAEAIEAITLEGDPEIDWTKTLSVAPKEFKAENCIRCKECVKNCPASAIDSETLEVNEDVCIHCQRCSFVCEYNARSYDTSVKRDFIEGNLSIKKPVEYFI